MHDPATDMRHFHGGQYRSLMYYTTPAQKQEVEKALAREQAKRGRAILSEVGPAP